MTSKTSFCHNDEIEKMFFTPWLEAKVCSMVTSYSMFSDAGDSKKVPDVFLVRNSELHPQGKQSFCLSKSGFNTYNYR